MSRVAIDPPSFTLVDFDADELVAIIEGLLHDIGIDGPVTLEVDQTTPLGLASVKSIDPIVLFTESGALENPHKLRALSPSGARNVLGRLLFRVRDRLDPAFGDPPPDGEIGLEVSAAWDVYCVGRLVRLGHTHFDEEKRRLYQFRTRHGFTDAADAAFRQLWAGDGLTWGDIERISTSALAAA
jgi:hypothetical protein